MSTVTSTDNSSSSVIFSSLTPEQEDGVKMIIFLQGMAGTTETPENALKGWNSMTAAEQATTKEVYHLFSMLK